MHPTPVAVYVINGTLTVEMDGRDSLEVIAGQAGLEPIYVRMRAVNKTSKPSEVVTFQVSGLQDPFMKPTE